MTPRMFYTLARVLAALTVIPFHEAGHALAAWPVSYTHLTLPTT